ncbi:hypothetical protein, partial [Raoultella planticola]|uniref:hypothetical protein n=1 Tax=Raoultella planticola TaxID=575 RepID=UPI001980D45C
GFRKVLPDGLIEKSQRNHFLIMCPEHIRQNYNLSEGEKAMAGGGIKILTQKEKLSHGIC